MVSGSRYQIAIVTLVVTFIAGIQAGIVTNQSISSSSSSVSSGSPAVAAVQPKSPRAGKVLYTAPYSNVRVTKHEMLIAQGKPRSFGPGPVLVKSKKMEDQPSRSVVPSSAPPSPSEPINPSTTSTESTSETGSSESTAPDTTTFITEPSN